MSNKRILIVGDSLNATYDYLRDHGYDYVVLKDQAADTGQQSPQLALCTFANEASVLAMVDTIVAERPLDGVLVTYERYIRIASRIANHLNLPALPLAAAEACTDKYTMRQLFTTAPFKLSPDFAVITSEADVRAFAANHSFPLIIKPANLSKSLLVTKNTHLEQLLQNYRKTVAAVDEVYAKYAPHTQPKLLIEEFMEGPVKSVDAFVDSFGEPHILDAIVDYQTGHDIGFADNFHYSRLLPTNISGQQAAAIKRTAAAGIKALGIKNSPAHVEIIDTKDGPMIVEIGARNGGYRTRMHALANGIDILDNAIRLSLGQMPNVTATRNESVGVFELFPKNPGYYVQLQNEATLRKLPSLYYLSVKAQPNTFVGSSSDGYKMCAVVILHNADQQQFTKDMQFLNKHVAVETRQGP
jgi:biotin carboxylase